MKYCRFQRDGQAHYGLVESVAGKDSILRILLAPPEQAGGDVEGLRTRRIEPLVLEEASLLPPVQPSKIVCVGRNYREHAAELGNEVPTEPLLFFKPPSSLLPPGGTILRPKASERTDYEGELGVVIARRCHKLASGEDPRPYILGYTCVNDFTARDLQNKDGQWTRAKGFDTFCPFGPWIDTDFNIADALITCKVNGQPRQMATTRDMVFSVGTLVAFVSSVMTLEPGDLIFTGTPAGVGVLEAGSEVVVEIEGLGVLRNTGKAESR